MENVSRGNSGTWLLPLDCARISIKTNYPNVTTTNATQLALLQFKIVFGSPLPRRLRNFRDSFAPASRLATRRTFIGQKCPNYAKFPKYSTQGWPLTGSSRPLCCTRSHPRRSVCQRIRIVCARRHTCKRKTSDATYHKIFTWRASLWSYRLQNCLLQDEPTMVHATWPGRGCSYKRERYCS